MSYAPPQQFEPSRSSPWRMVIVVLAIGGVVGMCLIGVLVALMLPALQAARDAARRSAAMNNMKYLAIAQLNYADVNGALPPAVSYSPEGQPLHSWRTQILPYLEQAALYEQLDTTQPWDSAPNAVLKTTSMPTYDLALQGSQSQTTVMVVVGDETPFLPQGKSLRPQDIADGQSQTALMVEVNGPPVAWAEPKDLAFQLMDMHINGVPGNSIGSHRRTAIVSLADGAVRAVAPDIDPQVVRAVITAKGGESVDAFFDGPSR